jgi:hypothetical protein
MALTPATTSAHETCPSKVILANRSMNFFGAFRSLGALETATNQNCASWWENGGRNFDSRTYQEKP